MDCSSSILPNGDETHVIYATLVNVLSCQRQNWLSILDGVYLRSLQWAYIEAWNDPANLIKYMPPVRTHVILSSNYVIDDDSIAYSYSLWRKLFGMAISTGKPLPSSKRIVPRIVAHWNKSKGRIDEMTRHLDDMLFHFSHGTPKQLLIMRELKKVALTCYFVRKHVFPRKTFNQENIGFSRMMRQRTKNENSMKNILYELTSTYTLMGQLYGMMSGSPITSRRGRACAKYGDDNNTDDDDDGVDYLSNNLVLRNKQKQAKKYCNIMMKARRKKLEAFIENEELVKIRMDAHLRHSPLFLKKFMNEEREDRPTKRVSLPYCIVCYTLDKKRYNVRYKCSICGVGLCIKNRNNRRRTCFQLFHEVKNVDS